MTAPPSRPRVLVTRRLPPPVEQHLEADYEAILNPSDRPLDATILIQTATERAVEGLVVTPTDRIDRALIAALPDSVRIIACFSVGHEHVDLTAATLRDITVTNTPEVLTDATADLALLLILAAARRAYEGQAMLRAGQWTGWAPTQLLGIHLGGRRLGIVGLGRIGQAVAARARAFGMIIHYHGRHRLPPDQEQGAVFHATLESLLAVSEVLSLHCPLTPTTRHLLDTRRIALLPEGALVVNTARGPVVDDGALIAALRSGRVAAAGLDVYEGEPAVHPGYLKLANVCLLPHLGSATVETRKAMGFKVLANLEAFFSGHEPPNRVGNETKP